MKVIFFGSGYYVIPIVETLIPHGLNLVVTTEPEGELINFLKTKNIPYLFSNLKSHDDIEQITSLTPELGVLASFGAILPKKIIDVFPHGILNIHPSLLPAFKGPSPIQFTILSGVFKTGVSVIKLDDEVDHGPVASQEEVSLHGDETFKSLKESLFLKGSGMINSILKDIESGKEITFTPQDQTGESWTNKITKTDGKIDLNNPLDPVELDRRIRAYYPWPGVFFSGVLSGVTKTIKLLPEQKIQVEGKNPMDIKSFINGYGKEALDILEKLGFN